MSQRCGMGTVSAVDSLGEMRNGPVATWRSARLTLRPAIACDVTKTAHACPSQRSVTPDVHPTSPPSVTRPRHDRSPVCAHCCYKRSLLDAIVASIGQRYSPYDCFEENKRAPEAAPLSKGIFHEPRIPLIHHAAATPEVAAVSREPEEPRFETLLASGVKGAR